MKISLDLKHRQTRLLQNYRLRSVIGCVFMRKDGPGSEKQTTETFESRFHLFKESSVLTILRNVTLKNHAKMYL